MELELEKIAKNVLIARTIKGYTQEGLASKIGMTQAWVQKVEKGDIDLSVSSINKLSEGLKIKAINLLFSSPSQVFDFLKSTQIDTF